jgi:Uma2 family endonuclease
LQFKRSAKDFPTPQSYTEAMSTISTTKMTAEQFLMLGEDPPGIRLELVDGVVAVSPIPVQKHSHVVVNLLTILNNHILSNDLGELHQDVDTLLDDFNIRRPDILFYSNENLDLIGLRSKFSALAASPSTVKLNSSSTARPACGFTGSSIRS